jgi:hypothetical protein
MILLSLCTFFTISIANAQTVTPQVMNVTGGTYNDPNSYFRVDWNVGEMAVATLPNPLGGGGLYVVSQGLLQPYINNFDIDHGGNFTSDEIRVFPNPADIYVEVNFKTKQKGKVQMHFYSELGQRIYSKSFQSYGLDRIEKITMDRLAAGTYILYIELVPDLGSRPKKGTYKIVKIP